jgi:hypothetical protein
LTAKHAVEYGLVDQVSGITGGKKLTPVNDKNQHQPIIKKGIVRKPFFVKIAKIFMKH